MNSDYTHFADWNIYVLIFCILLSLNLPAFFSTGWICVNLDYTQQLFLSNMCFLRQLLCLLIGISGVFNSAIRCNPFWGFLLNYSYKFGILYGIIFLSFNFWTFEVPRICWGLMRVLLYFIFMSLIREIFICTLYILKDRGVTTTNLLPYFIENKIILNMKYDIFLGLRFFLKFVL